MQQWSKRTDFHTLGRRFPVRRHASYRVGPSSPPNHTTYHVRWRKRLAASITPLRRSLNATVHLLPGAAAAAVAVEPIESSGIAESFDCQSG